MINEEGLNALEEVMNLHPNGTHAVFVEKKLEGAWMLDSEIFKELIRLSRIGLQIGNK